MWLTCTTHARAEGRTRMAGDREVAGKGASASWEGSSAAAAARRTTKACGMRRFMKWQVTCTRSGAAELTLALGCTGRPLARQKGPAGGLRVSPHPIHLLSSLVSITCSAARLSAIPGRHDGEGSRHGPRSKSRWYLSSREDVMPTPLRAGASQVPGCHALDALCRRSLHRRGGPLGVGFPGGNDAGGRLRAVRAPAHRADLHRTGPQVRAPPALPHRKGRGRRLRRLRHGPVRHPPAVGLDGVPRRAAGPP